MKTKKIFENLEHLCIVKKSFPQDETKKIKELSVEIQNALKFLSNLEKREFKKFFDFLAKKKADHFCKFSNFFDERTLTYPASLRCLLDNLELFEGDKIKLHHIFYVYESSARKNPLKKGNIERGDVVEFIRGTELRNHPLREKTFFQLKDVRYDKKRILEILTGKAETFDLFFEILSEDYLHSYKRTREIVETQLTAVVSSLKYNSEIKTRCEEKLQSGMFKKFEEEMPLVNMAG